FWIDGREGAYRTAVIGENDLVVGFVVHDAVQAAFFDLDLLDYGKRLQIEHGDGRIAAIGCKAVTRLGGDAGAVQARRVRNVPQYFARWAVDHHHVSSARNEHTAGGGFDGDVVRAAVAFDVELFYFELLRMPAGREDADCN